MTRRTRALLAALGMLLLIAALALLIYALSPNPFLRSVFPIAPTLFAPPGGGG
jgi:hypothetical protein